jgi:hypothetical protein
LPPAICGEYCELLVGSLWKPRPTPGIVAARFANCRPFSGRLSIFDVSTTPPTEELLVWISGDSAVTCTLSATPASFRSTFKSTVELTLTTMFFASYGENPASSACTS